MLDDEIKVSVICAAFNHEKYICDALDSIINQKTDFRFEVIVHDDCSSDNTRNLIEKYAELNHNIVTLFETSNQYKNGVSMIDLMTRKARGEYIAICECDDYWTSPDKLQTQYDYMINNNNCVLCCHSGYIVNESGIKIGEFQTNNLDKKYDTDSLIKEWICPTASIMFKKDTFLKSTFPSVKEMNAPCGDYPLLVNMSLYGDVYYFKEKMCAYRKNRESVSANWDNQKMLNINNRFINMLDIIDKYTLGKYHVSIQYMKQNKLYHNMLIQGDFKRAKSNEFESIYKCNKKEFYYYYAKIKLPFLYFLYKKFKNLVFNIKRKEKIYPVKEYV